METLKCNVCYSLLSMLPLRYFLIFKSFIMDQNIVIPISGMLTAIIIVSVVFIWLYLEEKGKREAIIEISKHLNDPRKLEELLGFLRIEKRAT